MMKMIDQKVRMINKGKLMIEMILMKKMIHLVSFPDCFINLLLWNMIRLQMKMMTMILKRIHNNNHLLLPCQHQPINKKQITKIKNQFHLFHR